ncbi:MAG TPA: energy transducer TonB [Terriglobales bacterium]|nr:energy transducer TonB [Terriglobales bacterium]
MKTLMNPLFLLILLPSHAAAQGSQSGFIDCSGRKDRHFALAFEEFCEGRDSTKLSCGEKVQVLKRVRPWLNILTKDGVGHYVRIESVSSDPRRLVTFDLPSQPIPDCSRAWAGLQGKHNPSVLFAPDPEYTVEARRTGLQGIVVLSSNIGADGIVRDIKVRRPLGMGLDQKAVEIVQEWLFRPALENGKPIPTKLDVEVLFRLGN